MKLTILLLAFSLSTFVTLSQSKRQSSSLSGIKYSIPDNWAIDDFSSSSVCDCYGTIILDYDSLPDLKIAIYPYLDSDTAMYERSFVWGGQFVADSGSLKIEKTISKRIYSLDKGVLDGRNVSYAYRLKPISNHPKHYNHIIYIFSKSESLNFEDQRISDFIDSIRFTKK